MKKIVLIIMMIIFIMSGCNQEVEQEQEEIRTSVEVSEVKLDSINLVTTFTGRVQSEKTIPVLTQTPGEVDEIYVSNNQYVKKGDKLFSLVSTNNLRQLQQAQASYDSAYANYLQTEDQLNLAIENYERTKKLFEAGAVSESQLEQTKAQASKQPLNSAQAALDQARLNLETAQDSYSDTVVKANSSGTISEISIEEGSFASNTQPTMMISDNNDLIIKLNVSEKYVNKISQGDQVGIDILATEMSYDGVVNEVGSTIDTNTMLYPAKVAVSNNESSIKAGMIAQVQIITDSKEQALIIPSEAVLLRGNIEIVFVNEDQVAIQKEVKTGIDNGDTIEIVNGLEVAEEVIVLGQNFLSNGDKINVVRGE